MSSESDLAARWEDLKQFAEGKRQEAWQEAGRIGSGEDAAYLRGVSLGIQEVLWRMAKLEQDQPGCGAI